MNKYRQFLFYETQCIYATCIHLLTLISDHATVFALYGGLVGTKKSYNRLELLTLTASYE